MGAMEQAKAMQGAEAFTDRLVINRKDCVFQLSYVDPREMAKAPEQRKALKTFTVKPLEVALIPKDVLKALHEGPGARVAKAMLKMLDPITPGEAEELAEAEKAKAKA